MNSCITESKASAALRMQWYVLLLPSASLLLACARTYCSSGRGRIEVWAGRKLEFFVQLQPCRETWETYLNRGKPHLCGATHDKQQTLEDAMPGRAVRELSPYKSRGAFVEALIKTTCSRHMPTSPLWPCVQLCRAMLHSATNSMIPTRVSRSCLNRLPTSCVVKRPGSWMFACMHVTQL